MSFSLKTTTAFVPIDCYPDVYLYKVSNEFIKRWYELASIQKSGFLPYGYLVNALKFNLGHFLCFRPFMDLPEHGKILIASERAIDIYTLATLIDFWEVEISKDSTPLLGDIVKNGGITEITMPLSSHILKNRDRCPTANAWVWEAALWYVSRKFSAEPMKVDGDKTISFRMDSDGALVAWDSLISRTVKDRHGFAMHILRPRLITIPGHDEPAIHIDSSLSMLSDDINHYNVSSGWVDVGTDVPLIRLGTRNMKGNGVWVKGWKDFSVKLLHNTGYRDIKEAFEYDNSDKIKVRFNPAPRYYPIGKGVGNAFHHYVASHMKKALPGEPFLLKRLPNLSAREKLSEMTVNMVNLEERVKKLELSEFRICCLYSDPIVREYFTRELARLLSVSDIQLKVVDGQWVKIGRVSVLFISPAHSSHYLTEFVEESDLEKWLDKNINPIIKADSINGFIVQTCDVEKLNAFKKSKDNPIDLIDPKPFIRRWLAIRGGNSQFLTAATQVVDTKGVCHSAMRAIHDLFRATGMQLIPYESGALSDKQTWYLGIYVRKSKREFHGYLTACLAGSTDTYIYTASGQWLPMHKGIAASWASLERTRNKQQMKAHLEKGLTKWRDMYPSDIHVVLVETIGARRIWQGLADTNDIDAGLPCSSELPLSLIVRYRNDINEVPRPAGSKAFNLGPERDEEGFNPGSRWGIFRSMNEQFGLTFYCTEGSKTLKADKSRKYTRYSTPEQFLGQDRHAQRMTEVSILSCTAGEASEWIVPLARLCFQNTTWLDNQMTELPSPIHVVRSSLEDWISDSPREE